MRVQALRGGIVTILPGENFLGVIQLSEDRLLCDECGVKATVPAAISSGWHVHSERAMTPRGVGEMIYTHACGMCIKADAVTGSDWWRIQRA